VTARSSPGKKRARRLQKQTGWSYSECLRCVRSMSENEIDELIDERARKELERERKEDG